MIEKRNNLSDTKRNGVKEERTRGEDIIAGRNAVSEALRAGRTIDSLYVVRGTHTGPISALIAKAKKAGAAIKEADARKLDAMCGNANHQGVVAVAAVKEFSQMEDIFRLAEERGEAPFLILCDELEDPHNLGAVIRIAECAGAHGVVIPKRRSVGLTYAVGKASAGAVEYVPVVRVNNMANTIDELKETWRVDLHGRYGRRKLVRCGLQRPCCRGSGQRRLRRKPSGKRKIRFCDI